MSLHRLLCKLGIHEWSASSRHISATGQVRGVRACWCCDANQTTYVEPDLGCIRSSAAEMLEKGPEMLEKGPEMLEKGPEMLEKGPEKGQGGELSRIDHVFSSLSGLSHNAAKSRSHNAANCSKCSKCS